MADDSECCPWFARPLERRAALKAALSIVLGLNFVHVAAAQDVDPRNARPQDGDQLVFADGDRQGEIVTRKDPPLGGPHVRAFPVDPRIELIRAGRALTKSYSSASIPTSSARRPAIARRMGSWPIRLSAPIRDVKCGTGTPRRRPCGVHVMTRDTTPGKTVES